MKYKTYCGKEFESNNKKGKVLIQRVLKDEAQINELNEKQKQLLNAMSEKCKECQAKKRRKTLHLGGYTDIIPVWDTYCIAECIAD